MTRWLLRGAVLSVTLLGAIAVLSSVTYADPPIRSARLGRDAGREFNNDSPQLQTDKPGYTLHYSFSSDPKDNTYVASFAPDVPEIYAWATIVEENGAQQKQFEVETLFIAPDGTPIDSEWYGEDTGTVSTYPVDADTFSDENVARRFIRVAGTSNAGLAGQWTVNFSVGGKLISSGNFSLADAGDIEQSDTASNAQQALEERGYEVIEFTELEGKSGNLFAFVIMRPVSQDLYSSETSQQIVDGLAALRQTFPDSGTLYTFLRFDERYEIAYWADALDVDAYLQDNDFGAFAQVVSVDVYDNETGEYLGSASKDFINKNFGAGTYRSPANPPLSKNSSSVGSVRVTVSPSELPADGASKAIVSVEVFSKRNLPIQDAEIEFEISGSGEGTVRPRVTSTDENGQADAVFTAGRTNGLVTITAKVGGISGAGTITLGTGSADQPADNVIAMLSAQGYQATRVGFLDQAKSQIGVLVDLGDSYNINQVTGPIVYGMTALRMNYPDAATLVVIVPFKENLLMFPASASAYDSYYQAIGAAKSDDDKKAASSDFLNKVFANAQYVDRNGNKLSTFKDFYNKNFMGG
ncbi:MAG: hypothetical protein IT331_11545 [Anaerolineae bacterium]|nr:hypothetical protein [Anaerolineae bacterium]